MLYLVGGASRAGKSTLARRLLAREGIPYFSIDVLMMGLVNGWPEFGLDPETPSEVRGEKLWPIVRAMAVNLLEEAPTHPTYLLEGDSLLPKHVAALADEYGDAIKTCFIGYACVQPEEKLREIRRSEPGWSSHYTHQQALDFVEQMVRYSAYLQAECAALGLWYLDCSAGIAPTIDDAMAYLVAAPSPRSIALPTSVSEEP